MAHAAAPIAFTTLLVSLAAWPDAPYNKSIQLPDVLVESKKREALHLVCYLREYSSMSSYSDTVFLFREKTVDFMVPLKRKTSFEGWLSPRLLASKSYYRFTDPTGTDSISNHFRQHFSWSDWIGIFKSAKLPAKLAEATVKAAGDTVYGRYSPSMIWNRDDQYVSLDLDVLADTDNSLWTPGMFDLFNNRVEFTRFKVHYLFNGVDGSDVYADNIACISFDIESQGRGRGRTALSNFNDNGSVYINTYAELYVADMEYMTIGDARKCEHKPPKAEDIGIRPPRTAPPLDPTILALKERVDNFDYLGHRLLEEADSRLAGKKIPEVFQKRDRAFIKYLKSIISNNTWPSNGRQGNFRN